MHFLQYPRGDNAIDKIGNNDPMGVCSASSAEPIIDLPPGHQDCGPRDDLPGTTFGSPPHTAF